MATWTVINTRSGLTLGAYSGETPAHAIASLLRDAGYTASVEDGEVTLGDDAPATVRDGLDEIEAVEV